MDNESSLKDALAELTEDVAESVSGVKDVHNRLTIQQVQHEQQSGQQSRQEQEVAH